MIRPAPPYQRRSRAVCWPSRLAPSATGDKSMDDLAELVPARLACLPLWTWCSTLTAAGRGTLSCSRPREPTHFFVSASYCSRSRRTGRLASKACGSQCTVSCLVVQINGRVERDASTRHRVSSRSFGGAASVSTRYRISRVAAHAISAACTCEHPPPMHAAVVCHFEQRLASRPRAATRREPMAGRQVRPLQPRRCQR